MPDFRCYCPNLDPKSDQVTLSAFESHHLVATNRARKEDEVVIFNGAGLESVATLTEADRKQAVLIRKKNRMHSRPSRQIELAIALIKGKTFDIILRQATEMGVTSIQPLLTDHTQVQWKENPGKLEKWSAQLVEGCKQSGNPWLPKMAPPLKVQQFLDSKDQASMIVASLEPDTTARTDLVLSDTITLLIGPEGDFSKAEYEKLRKYGVQSVSLGPNILRSETAALALLSLITLGSE